MLVIDARPLASALYTFIVCSLICATAVAGGRPSDTRRSWFGGVAGGWTLPQGDSDDVLDGDLTIGAGALYWPSTWPVGIQLEGAYANFDVKNDVIAAINDAVAQDPFNSGRIDDGEVESWQFTANAVWGPGDEDNGLYLTAGIGVYRLEATLTEDGLVYYPPTCDPWFWWWCYPGGFGQGAIVRDRDSTTEVGWNAGLGYSFESGGGALFVEAKYHSIDTRGPELSADHDRLSLVAENNSLALAADRASIDSRAVSSGAISASATPLSRSAGTVNSNVVPPSGLFHADIRP
jgi:hypothetical protein